MYAYTHIRKYNNEAIAGRKWPLWTHPPSQAWSSFPTPTHRDVIYFSRNGNGCSYENNLKTFSQHFTANYIWNRVPLKNEVCNFHLPTPKSVRNVEKVSLAKF